MREGWTYKKLGEVITPAKVIKNRLGEDLPILSITMHEGIVSQKDRFKKVIASVDTSEYKIVKNGQLVIAFPIDEGLLYTQDLVEEGIMSPAYNIWDVDYNCINRSFLVRYLHCPFAFSYYKSKLRGTTMRRRNIPREDLLNMPLPLPPKSQQEAIVSELDEINSLLALKREQLQKYDKLAQSLFYEMFGDPVENEKGWEVKNLGDACSMKAGKAIKATELSESNAYPCYGGNGIRGYINKISHTESAPIIGRQGAYCGTVNFAAAPFYATEHAVVVRPLQEMDIYWLYYTLINLKLSRFAKGQAQPGISVGNLSEEVYLPLPPLPLQQQFASRIEQIESQKHKVQAAIEKLETLLASRMQYWFE